MDLKRNCHHLFNKRVLEFSDKLFFFFFLSLSLSLCHLTLLYISAFSLSSYSFCLFPSISLSLSLSLFLSLSLYIYYFLSLRISLSAFTLSLFSPSLYRSSRYVSLKKNKCAHKSFLFNGLLYFNDCYNNFFSEMCLFPDYFRRRCSFLATHRLTRLHLLGRWSLVIWLWMVWRLGRWSGLSAMHWAPSLDSSRTAGERWPAERKK